MLPGNFPITITKGKTYSLGFSGKLDDGQTFTFDSYTDIILTVRQPWVHAQDAEAPILKQWKMSTGEFAVSGDSTSFDLNLTAAATALLDFNEGRYELDLYTDIIEGDDIIDPFLKGKITVLGTEDS